MATSGRFHAGQTSVAALAGAAVLTASLAGCSHTSFFPSVNKPTVTYKGGAIAPTNDANVVLDGQEHKVDGQIACTALDGGETVIAIGREPNAVKISLTDTSDAPRVKMVILQNLAGYNLFVLDPPDRGEAAASKDGRRYTIAGTSWGLDTHNDGVTKPFLITLTCP